MKKKTTILGPIRKYITIVILAFIAILVSFVIFHIQSVDKDNNDKIIINIYGKQRMYTQQISKDASRILALMQSLELGDTYQPEDTVRKKIKDTKESLKSAKLQFAETLEALHKGYIDLGYKNLDIRKAVVKSQVYLKDIGLLWESFERAIDILVASTEINEETAKAVIFINENNMKLLEQSDLVLTSIQEASIKNTEDTKVIFYVLIIILVILICVSLFNLVKFIILPFHELYQGIAEIGLTKDKEQKNFLTKRRVDPIVSDINEMFHKINHLISLIENVNNNSSFLEILNYINQTFSAFIPYNYIGIALFDENKQNLKASYGVSDGSIRGLPDNIKDGFWPIDNTSLGNLIQSGEVRIINDLEDYTKGKPMKLYNKVLLEAGIRASITLPLKVSGDPIGVIFFSSKNKNVYNTEHINFLKTLVNSIAISFKQNIFIHELLYSSVYALAKLAESRDEDTGDHLERMKIYSRVIAQLLYEHNIYTDEIDLEFIESIERFSPLHDIGKVGIRDGILLKPARLTEDEFEEMKKHALYGANVLRAAEKSKNDKGKSVFQMGVDIAEGHHERWNGSGYPYGKKEEEIPLSARIVAIADVFDALTSKRPYKEPFSVEKSFKMIEEGSGNHFDPVIVKIFLTNKDTIIKIYQEYNI